MKNKFYILFILFLAINFNIFSVELQQDSYFMLMGEYELRLEKGFSNPVVYSTLNHEGGVKLKVLEIAESDSLNGKKGKWLKVLTVSSMWVSTGDWIEKYQKYWIFLLDETLIFNYQE